MIIRNVTVKGLIIDVDLLRDQIGVMERITRKGGKEGCLDGVLNLLDTVLDAALDKVEGK